MLKVWAGLGFVLALALAGLLGWHLTQPPGFDEPAAPDFGPRPNFGAISQTAQLRAAFYGYLAPMVDYHNGRILRDRQYLQQLQARLAAGKRLGRRQREWLAELAQRYYVDQADIDAALYGAAATENTRQGWTGGGVGDEAFRQPHKSAAPRPSEETTGSEAAEGSPEGRKQRQRKAPSPTQPLLKSNDPAFSDAGPLAELLRRVDLMPTELALVQAALESGWGRSRFAVEANNIYGQWCYKPGCGLVPAGRAASARHEVRLFPTVAASVQSYLKNINTHRSYNALRDIRADLRARGVTPTGELLAPGLLRYSQRRQAYVDDVLAMLRQYRALQQQLHQNPHSVP